MEAEQRRDVLRTVTESIDSARQSSADAVWLDNEDVGVALSLMRQLSGEKFPDVKVFTYDDEPEPRRVALELV